MKKLTREDLEIFIVSRQSTARMRGFIQYHNLCPNDKFFTPNITYIFLLEVERTTTKRDIKPMSLILSQLI